MKITIKTLLAIIFISTAANAANNTPYFASISASEANIRTGPSVRYPIRWVYEREKWPIEVTATFESWRKVRDIHGEIGWIHKSLLTGKRNALIKTKGVQEVYRLPINTSTVTMIVEKGVIAELVSCKNNWCKIKTQGIKGWIQSKHLWGVKYNEIVD